ncbi:PREDICTED: cytochrome P450 4c21-like [Wasmannia auropunctata]|uniref:cytochrome P450 4c21-like n=1 Tax=Wasmannia auropunctata TaxID=64793 RepID=UPI0005F000CE|nr:PREDICTED: cytochrome P450 4c21-like [Wasmannia auropunctata]
MLFVNVLICSAIVLISYFFWNFYQKVFFIKRLDNVPGLKTLPLIGSFYHLLKNFEDFLEVLVNILQDYPSLCQVWIGSKLLILISSPDIAKLVLNSKNCVDKASLYKLVSPLFGMGLLTAPESVWNRIRTMTAPTFSSHMLQRFFNTFVEQSVALTDELEKVGLNENEILYGDHIATCTLRIACDALMGVQLESNKNLLLLKPIERGKKILLHRLRNIHLYFFDTVFNLSAMGREQKKLLNVFHSIVDEMIQKSKDKLIQLDTTKDEEKQTHKTFFDIYMDASCKENFTQEEIRDNISTLLMTGSDTITVTCTFVVFMLANFPEIQVCITYSKTTEFTS